MKFLERLGSAMAMTLYDTYKSEKSQDKNMGNLNQKCKEEISKNGSEIFDKIIELSNIVNSESTPAELATGTVFLPVYAFQKVLQNQIIAPSFEQGTLLDIYFNSMSFSFTKKEFINSININNKVTEEIESLVGVSESYLGNFWETFFNFILKTSKDENIISEIVLRFNNIVTSFTTLGNPQSTVAFDIRENFIKLIDKQYNIYKKKYENPVYIFDKETYKDSLEKMKIITREIARNGKEDDIILVDLFDYFVVGLIITLLSKSTADDLQKEQILLNIMDDIDIDLKIDISPKEIITATTQESSLKKLTYDLVNKWDSNAMNYWIIQGIASEKGNCVNLTVDFLEECSSFLINIETQLKNKCPSLGFNQLSLIITIDVADHMSKLS